MSSEQQRLQAAIASLEAQRDVIGNAAVLALLAPARARLAAQAAAAAAAAAADAEPTQALKQVTTRAIEGVATRTIGPDAELQALQVAFERLFTERKLAAVTVVAEAGIGKSRLLDDFDAWCETRAENFSLFRGRATPQTQPSMQAIHKRGDGATP